MKTNLKKIASPTNIAASASALVAGLAGFLFWRNRSRTGGENAVPPGKGKSLQSILLEAGSNLVQNKPPLSAFSLYLNRFHFVADDMGRQTEAHHYCSVVNDDFIQCVIFDRNAENARLIGIEYIISERLFRTLPEDERRLWHSHQYEVKSGELIAPGLPDPIEHRLMDKLATTYGKTWYTWDPANRQFPGGIPSLMMTPTQDGQIRQDMISARDRTLKVSTGSKKENRRDIRAPKPAEGADSWRSGKTVQLDSRVVSTNVVSGELVGSRR